MQKRLKQNCADNWVKFDIYSLDAVLRAAEISRQLFCFIVGISIATYYYYKKHPSALQCEKQPNIFRTATAINDLLSSGVLPIKGVTGKERIKKQIQLIGSYFC